MQVRLLELAELVHGTVIGDGELLIEEAATLSCARPGQITLVDHPDKLPRLEASTASAAVVSRDITVDTLPVIQVDDVRGAFATIVKHFRPPHVRPRQGISPQAVISPAARLASDVEVGPFSTIGDDVEIGAGSTIHANVHIMAGSKIGPGVTIYPGAVLYENTIVGARSLIHANVVLGAHGFGYTLVDGVHQQLAQLGHVEIGDDVDVGAGTTIDRGTYGPTTIGEGTKIDNLVQVGHNCRIGRHNLLCSQVGIAGSTSTGDYVVVAGQAGVRDHVHIGERAVVGAMSGIMADVAADSRVLGIPACPEREQMVKQAHLIRLPEMRRELKRLTTLVDSLAGTSAANDKPARRRPSASGEGGNRPAAA